ncbi:MAG: hypothetical protein SFV22_11870 [Saprospiraceae bacterium]|nr:hypothetical protein [Saprospiraceae bacterium]
MSNIYILSAENAVEKYDSTGRLVTRYTNNRLGAAEWIDAANPLKILVWYAGFQTAVFLDRNLTELGRLNLSQLGYPAVRCLASSADGNIWVYDEGSSHLLKLSASGEKLLESQPLNLAFARPFAPVCARDDGGQAVFLGDPAQGIAVFDPFAQLNRVVARLSAPEFEVINGWLVYLEKDTLHIEDGRGLAARKIVLPAGHLLPETRQWVSKRRWLMAGPENLRVFSY